MKANLIETKPPKEPLVGVGTSFVKKTRQSGVKVIKHFRFATDGEA